MSCTSSIDSSVPSTSLIRPSDTATTAGSTVSVSTSTVPLTTSPEAYSAINSAARSAATRVRLGSIPFSKRALASLRRPWSFEAWRTVKPL